MDDQLIAEATAVARRVIGKSVTPIGVVAAAEGYPQVWARDAMITGLGACADAGSTGLTALRVSTETLAAHLDRFGQVPYLVWLKDGREEFGSVDSNCWFVIGAATCAALGKDAAWAARLAEPVVRALDWCEGQDLRKTGLIQSGECADWADLMSNHGMVLFPNVLYLHALRVGADLLAPSRPADALRFRARRERSLAALQDLFWVKMHGTVTDQSHTQARQHMSVTLRKRPYFLPWIDGFTYGERFDVAANLLAILAGVADAAQGAAILDYIEQAGLDRPFPVRGLYPPIQPGERDWRDYFKVFNLNLPHQYLNGGIWPWVGGLYVAALVKAGRRDRAAQTLSRLAEALRQGREPWECNEWLHGESGMAMGFKDQAWSAGMFLYAKRAVETGELIGFG